MNGGDALLTLRPAVPFDGDLPYAMNAWLISLISDAETEAEIETITTLGQSILKREWQRVKSGT